MDKAANKALEWREGYRAAEKDLVLNWKDVAILITIYEQEVEAGNISRYEDEGAPALQEGSEIILKRFYRIQEEEPIDIFKL